MSRVYPGGSPATPPPAGDRSALQALPAVVAARAEDVGTGLDDRGVVEVLLAGVAEPLERVGQRGRARLLEQALDPGGDLLAPVGGTARRRPGRQDVARPGGRRVGPGAGAGGEGEGRRRDGPDPASGHPARLVAALTGGTADPSGPAGRQGRGLPPRTLERPSPPPPPPPRTTPRPPRGP